VVPMCAAITSAARPPPHQSFFGTFNAGYLSAEYTGCGSRAPKLRSGIWHWR
jgi:hypothetical protein